MRLRRRPYTFTGPGVTMLSAILQSDRSIALGIAAIRLFVRLF
jgi:hypothetical protein